MWTSRLYRLLGVALVVVLENGVNAQREGDSCNHSSKGVSGICKRLDQCSVAIQDLQLGVYPQTCGFVDNILMVCCPTDTETTTTTTTTTSTITKLPNDQLPVGERSRRACESYKMLAYRNSSSLYGENEIIENCPWEHGSVAVVFTGKVAEQGEFPHMVLLGYDPRSGDGYSWDCGGSLISEKYVLSVANCRQARSNPRVARLGDLDYMNPDDDQYLQEIKIKTHIPHPRYHSYQQYNDIGLLELEHPAQLNLRVKPICLYRWNPATKVRSGMIAGWGYTDYDARNSKLLKGGVQYFNDDACKKTYFQGPRAVPEYHIDEETQICFGRNTENHVDLCRGDSGIPLQIYNKDVYCSYYLFGIASIGNGCGRLGKPSVYTNLYPFIEWIENIVWP